MNAHRTQSYKNVMEILVNQEVQRQLKRLPNNLLKYIDPLQVATHALNHLPPLYASSEEGARQQKHRGEESKEQIAIAVRRGIAAVQRDPLRASTPLEPEVGTEYYNAYLALHELEDLLEQGPLTWRNLVSMVRYTLIQAIHGDLTRQQVSKITEHEHRRGYDRYRGL
jgi:Late competence development protein ComFB